MQPSNKSPLVLEKTIKAYENYAEFRVPSGAYFSVRLSLKAKSDLTYWPSAYTGMLQAAELISERLPVILCYYSPFEYTIVFQRESDYCNRKVERILTETTSAFQSVLHGTGVDLADGDRLEGHVAILPSWDEIVYYISELQEEHYRYCIDHWTDEILMRNKGLTQRQAAVKRNLLRPVERQNMVKLDKDFVPKETLLGYLLTRDRHGNISLHNNLPMFKEDNSLLRFAIKETTLKYALARFREKKKHLRKYGK